MVNAIKFINIVVFVIKKGTLSIPVLKIFIPAQIAPELEATNCNPNDPQLNVSLDFDLKTL